MWELEKLLIYMYCRIRFVPGRVEPDTHQPDLQDNLKQSNQWATRLLPQLTLQTDNSMTERQQ